ncbi:hypothetical protein ACWNT8_15530 (plasmid) [Pigmentibacter ruber]
MLKIFYIIFLLIFINNSEAVTTKCDECLQKKNKCKAIEDKLRTNNIYFNDFKSNKDIFEQFSNINKIDYDDILKSNYKTVTTNESKSNKFILKYENRTIEFNLNCISCDEVCK